MLRIMAAAILICASMATTAPTFAQEQQLSPAQKPVILKPKMRLALWRGAVQFIRGVEIAGTEVDAFLDTRKVITDGIDAQVKAGKKDEDEITIELRLDQANNLFSLMQRGKVKAEEADLHKEITSSLQEAAKAVQAK
jgi:hypothetical protein